LALPYLDNYVDFIINKTMLAISEKLGKVILLCQLLELNF